MTPMKMARLTLGISLVFLALAVPVSANPFVGFQPDTMAITANGTFRTPAITITGADGITEINVHIIIPQGMTISTAVNSGNLTCVKQGLGVSGVCSYSEWDPIDQNHLRVTCRLTPAQPTKGGQVYSVQHFRGYLEFCQMGLGGSVTGGTGTALFGSLTISPPHAVSIVQLHRQPFPSGVIWHNGLRRCRDG